MNSNDLEWNSKPDDERAGNENKNTEKGKTLEIPSRFRFRAEFRDRLVLAKYAGTAKSTQD